MDYYNELYHYGVLGMKWGVRRYQNKDGTLTNVGKKRYNDDSDDLAYSVAKKVEAIQDFRDTTERYKKALYANPKKADRTEVLNKAQKTNAAYEQTNRIVEKLQKKYKKVDFDIMTETDTGEAYVRTALEDDLGQTYISEIYLGYHVK